MSNELRRIKTVVGELVIRRYEEGDIPFHEAYVYDSPTEFLEAIGFDTAKRRPRSEFNEFYKKRISDTSGTPRPNALVAELDGRAISIVPLDLRDDIDKFPRLHFHIFEADLRGKGMGGPILTACAEELSKLSGFKKFMIEPKASNVQMNRLMRKLGFRYVKDYLLPPHPGIQEMTVSQYEISIQQG